jgi:Tfp pilus assembly protein FimT
MNLDPPGKEQNRVSGFPLVEVCMILVILALLAVIVVPQL